MKCKESQETCVTAKPSLTDSSTHSYQQKNLCSRVIRSLVQRCQKDWKKTQQTEETWPWSQCCSRYWTAQKLMLMLLHDALFSLFLCVYGAIFMQIYSGTPALLCESLVFTAAGWKRWLRVLAEALATVMLLSTDFNRWHSKDKNNKKRQLQDSHQIKPHSNTGTAFWQLCKYANICALEVNKPHFGVQSFSVTCRQVLLFTSINICDVNSIKYMKINI